jgi:hypothetical protein
LLGSNLTLASGKSLALYGQLDLQASAQVNVSGGGLSVFGPVNIASGAVLQHSAGPLFFQQITNGGSWVGSLPAGPVTISADTTNNSLMTVTGAGKAATTVDYFGPCINNGTIRTTTVAITWYDLFTNHGLFVSSSSENHFTDLTVGSGGVLQAGDGDAYFIAGDLTITGANASSWNTHGARMYFEDFAPHTFITQNGQTFGWDALELGSGATLAIVGQTLYLNELVLDEGVSQLSSITGQGLTLYLDADDPVNTDIFANPSLLKGIKLVALPTPEPARLILLGAGSLCVLSRRRRRGTTS